MKDRILAIIALLIATAAVFYTGWLHQHSKRFAEEALKERETNFVRANAPLLKRVYRDMLGAGSEDFDPNKFDPKTLEEMIYPMVITIKRIQGGSVDGTDAPVK